MQDLGTEIGQLCCLLKVELVYGICLVNDARVVVVHAVDVGPDLNFLSTESHADERSCEIAAATLQVVYLAISVEADETLCDVDLVALVLGHDGCELFFYILCVGLSVLVGAHEVESREKCGLDALFLKVVEHHVRAHDLALCHDALLLEAGEDVFGEGTHVLELFSQKFASLFFIFVRGIELFHMLHIFLFQRVDYLIGSVGVLLVEIV